MNHRLTIRRHGRAIAMVGALVAVGATTTMALVAGTASAAAPATQPGKCIDNVNVRADASTASKIVAVCETGTAVTVAETRDGFVHLTNLKGWAAQEYVSVNGKAPAAAPPERATPATTAPATTAPATTAPEPNRTAPAQDGTPPAARTPGTSGNDVGDANAGDANAADTTPAATDNQGSAGRPPVGGLFG